MVFLVEEARRNLEQFRVFGTAVIFILILIIVLTLRVLIQLKTSFLVLFNSMFTKTLFPITTKSKSPKAASTFDIPLNNFFLTP